MIAYHQAQSCLERKIGIFATSPPMSGLLTDRKMVEDLVSWSGKSVAAIAKAAGIANTTLNRHANGTAITRLSQPTLDKLKTAFPGFPGFGAPEHLQPNAIPVKMEGASEERMREDLPVYGTALGAAREVDGEAIEQTTLNRAEMIQYVRRPVILNGNAAAYGLYVSGSSMHPRFSDGELIVVDPKGRLRGGDEVVVYLRPTNDAEDNGTAARGVLVKRLVRRTSTYVELEQYSPAMIFRLPMEDIVRIDRVVPLSEMLT